MSRGWRGEKRGQVGGARGGVSALHDALLQRDAEQVVIRPGSYETIGGESLLGHQGPLAEEVPEVGGSAIKHSAVKACRGHGGSCGGRGQFKLARSSVARQVDSLGVGRHGGGCGGVDGVWSIGHRGAALANVRRTRWRAPAGRGCRGRRRRGGRGEARGRAIRVEGGAGAGQLLLRRWWVLCTCAADEGAAAALAAVQVSSSTSVAAAELQQQQGSTAVAAPSTVRSWGLRPSTCAVPYQWQRQSCDSSKATRQQQQQQERWRMMMVLQWQLEGWYDASWRGWRGGARPGEPSWHRQGFESSWGCGGWRVRALKQQLGECGRCRDRCCNSGLRLLCI